MKKYAVVIPAYRPKELIEEYVNGLVHHGVSHVIIVNDGNEESFEELFQRLSKIERTTVLKHSINRGKGAGLKTAIDYYLKYLSHLKGIVTADADGQHLLEDVLNIGNHLEKMDEGFVLGARVYNRKNMPPRSLIGNTVTSRVFQALFGTYIRDTQTGLRGIATSELEWVFQLRGDHFDFEMNMLINMVKKHRRIVQVDIEAVYEEVHVSHFNTYKDSVRIAGQMFKEFVE